MEQSSVFLTGKIPVRSVVMLSNAILNMKAKGFPPKGKVST